MKQVEMAEGQGSLHVGDSHALVTYQLKALAATDESWHVTVSLKAPRDWLLQMGFSSVAELQRNHDGSVEVGLAEPLDVGDNISVTLHSEAMMFDSREAMSEKFPEFGSLPGAV
ncbi:hypothetical protein FE840_003085 [Peteryoungia desertarenae]|uniref:Uncharacterized protein n=1 Tax=Peteryoungia desertarenae TaxID=1813451 RepID=A0ABX6QJ73_9HYPH|nr:hypothetical protein [Peteryoungia desertarenae]QLF68613.1 hypothetical protein FE840_003085 [Peteryoungia desertarenae]